jgi:hypothetical protein
VTADGGGGGGGTAAVRLVRSLITPSVPWTRW